MQQQGDLSDFSTIRQGDVITHILNFFIQYFSLLFRDPIVPLPNWFCVTDIDIMFGSDLSSRECLKTKMGNP